MKPAVIVVETSFEGTLDSLLERDSSLRNRVAARETFLLGKGFDEATAKRMARNDALAALMPAPVRRPRAKRTRKPKPATAAAPTDPGRVANDSIIVDRLRAAGHSEQAIERFLANRRLLDPDSSSARTTLRDEAAAGRLPRNETLGAVLPEQERRPRAKRPRKPKPATAAAPADPSRVANDSIIVENLRAAGHSEQAIERFLANRRLAL